jgi:hypothetical protein
MTRSEAIRMADELTEHQGVTWVRLGMSGGTWSVALDIEDMSASAVEGVITRVNQLDVDESFRTKFTGDGALLVE